MGWIRERIIAEERKHNHHDIDWARITEGKILMEIYNIIKDSLTKAKESQ